MKGRICILSTPILKTLSIWLTLFIFLAYMFFTRITYPTIQNPLYIHQTFISSLSTQTQISNPKNPKKTLIISNPKNPEKTQLKHIVFGIGASSKLWHRRKNYIKLWWRPHEMRGFVWLDKLVKNDTTSFDDGSDSDSLPPLKISSDTSQFEYSHKNGHRSALRISRIVSETLRLGMEDVRWIVMGDDDTLFVADNLVRVLGKYDHNEFYYIGSSSESHVQNILFSYNMAYGGGGFAVSYPLAKALERTQDRCMHRYPSLYGSDDRIQACMAELGVPLTREVGFHQFDVYGNLFGLLAAHPIAPVVSLHHLDLVEPIFPNALGQIQALQRLNVPMKLDSAGLMQQSICYERSNNWTVSVSWGFVVQIFRSVIPAREMETPQMTFLSWYRKADRTGFSFNTRPVSKNPCERAWVYTLSIALFDPSTNRTASEYVRSWGPGPGCAREKGDDPFGITRIEVYKKPDPYMWDKAPRRNCCRVIPTKKKNTMVIHVGDCREDEIIEF